MAQGQQDSTQVAAPGASDPTQAGAGDTDKEGGNTVVIEVTLDLDSGAITVEQESGSQEAGEESGGGDASGAQPVTVKDAAEAGSLVTQMLQSAGQSPEDQATAAKASQSQGYSQS